MDAKSYELLDHTADMGFRVRAASAEAALAASAAALGDLITPLSAIEPRVSRPFEVTGEDRPALLHAFLDELLFHFEVEGELLPIVRETRIEPAEGGGLRLRAVAAGEAIDPERHQIDRVVKAVTLHGLRFEPEDEGWVAEVILDL